MRKPGKRWKTPWRGSCLLEGRVVGLANHTLLIARDGAERPIADKRCAHPG